MTAFSFFLFSMFYVYILHSAGLDKFYVGHSHNPWNRLNQHLNNEGEKFTGKAKDWELVAIFRVSDIRGEAEKMEKFIKKQKSKSLILKLIDPEFVPIGALAPMVRVPPMRN